MLQIVLIRPGLTNYDQEERIQGALDIPLNKQGRLEVAEIIESLTPHAGDHFIKKHTYSAFHETDLEDFLRDHDIKELVITGVMTNLCCETSARDAFNRDFRVYFPADANATASEEMQLATLMNLAWGFAYVTSTADLLATFKGEE